MFNLKKIYYILPSIHYTCQISLVKLNHFMGERERIKIETPPIVIPPSVFAIYPPYSIGFFPRPATICVASFKPIPPAALLLLHGKRKRVSLPPRPPRFWSARTKVNRLYLHGNVPHSIEFQWPSSSHSCVGTRKPKLGLAPPCPPFFTNVHQKQ